MEAKHVLFVSEFNKEFEKLRELRRKLILEDQSCDIGDKEPSSEQIAYVTQRYTIEKWLTRNEVSPLVISLILCGIDSDNECGLW